MSEPEYLYTPSLKACEKHIKAGAPKAEELLVYPVCDKEGKAIPGKLQFEGDEAPLEKDQTIGLPVIWYKVKVIRP